MRIGDAKESYAADEALLQNGDQKLGLLIFFAVLAIFPFVAGPYWVYLACLAMINVASATGLNILTGFTGLVSMGQAAFMGVGAYTVAWLEINLGTPFVLNLVAGGWSPARSACWSACRACG